MLKRRWLYGAVLLLLGAVLWYAQRHSHLCQTCLPLPDLRSLFLPPPRMNLPYPPPPEAALWDSWPAAQRLADVNQRVRPWLMEELNKREMEIGQPVYLRAFKEERQLELWMRSATGWQLWRTYPIAAASGYAGPKLREGDMQVPEGFYGITSRLVNPASSYHLALNIGYPNRYDLQHQRTGSFIMIHGRAASIGCLAMTDPVIEEIFLLVAAALDQGQAEVPVHLFPFRMTEEKLASTAGHPWQSFWRHELSPAWRYFEAHHEPPRLSVREGRYELLPP